MLGYIVPYMEPSISPSTNMEAAFGRLHNSGAGAFGARPTVVDSIILAREAESIGIPKTYTQSELIPDQGRVFRISQKWSLIRYGY